MKRLKLATLLSPSTAFAFDLFGPRFKFMTEEGGRVAQSV
jgi:hypothetical protein